MGPKILYSGGVSVFIFIIKLTEHYYMKGEIRVKRIKLLCIVLCVLVFLSFVFSGCSGKAPEEGGAQTGTQEDKPAGDSSQKSEGKQITLTFWKAPHSEHEAELWKPILEKFENENPNIKIEHLVTPWDTWMEKYTAAFAGGDPPDVSYMTEWYPVFADANQLADLSPYITDAIQKRYPKGAWDYSTYKGKVIGIPFIWLNCVVFYNQEIFEEEGISIPKTWDEFLEAAKNATKDLDNDGQIDQWGTAFGLFPNVDIHQIMPSVIQWGASYLNEDQTELGFANEAGIEAIKFMTDLIIKEKVAPPIDMFDEDQLRDAIFKGKIAMYIGQIQFYGDIQRDAPDLKIGAFPVPAGPAQDEIAARANYGAGGMLSIAEACKNKDEAWKLIEFITEPENESLYLKSANFLSPNEETNKIMFPDDEIMAVASEAAKYSVNYPVHLKWKEIDTILKDMLEEIIREAKTAEQAIMDANEKAKNVLKE